MTPAARLQATLDLLALFEFEARPADALANGYFRARRYIGAKDRAAVAAMTYDILRHLARLNWWLEKTKTEPTPRLRFLTYLVLVEKKKPASLAALFTGGSFAPAKLDDDERKALKKLEGHTLDHPDMPDDIAVECPPWAAPALHKRFGKTFMKEMAALLEPAPVDLRVNTLKTTREEALAALHKQGLSAEPCRLSPLGIRLEGRPNLGALPLLREGMAEVQDEGSQLVALLVDAKPGERVIDYCAGAGGKTLALAAQMQNKGRLIACDVRENRLKRSTARFRRAGVHNIEFRVLNDTQNLWLKRQMGACDRVLVDAPCTGTGTWRRNPDQRWRTWGLGLDDITALQAQILAAAARLVKPGGRLVYATCSLMPRENEGQIETFLAAHPEFHVVPVENRPYLSLTPASHGTDGFFAAVMERSA
jgi:16S rRNA (cytosine967-C5)-methyltransferase